MCFNTEELRILSTQCIYVSRTILITNSDCFPNIIQFAVAMETHNFLWGTNGNFICSI
jgi:hypothetical protein